VKLAPAVALAVVLASTRLAAAATPDAAREARVAFQAGEAHFKAGAFDEALAKYRAGYEAKPLPGFLINIAQCQRRLGDLKGARVTYGKFVLVAPDSPLVPQAKAMIAELDRLLSEEEETIDSGTLGGFQTSREELGRAEPVLPHAIAPVQIAKAPNTPAPAPAPASESGRTRWWLWGAIGAAVIGGTVAAFALSGGETTIVDQGSLGTLRR